jgi:molecular chaperone Hsp33
MDLSELPCKKLADMILKDSYQMNGKVFLSEVSDQSVLIMKLPDINVNKVELDKRLSLSEYWFKVSPSINDIYSNSLSDVEEIKKSMSIFGATYLRSKDVGFKCACSRERMLLGLLGLMRSGENLFSHGEDNLETKCDYCKTYYLFTKKDLLEGANLN